MSAATPPVKAAHIRTPEAVPQNQCENIALDPTAKTLLSHAELAANRPNPLAAGVVDFRSALGRRVVQILDATKAWQIKLSRKAKLAGSFGAIAMPTMAAVLVGAIPTELYMAHAPLPYHVDLVSDSGAAAIDGVNVHLYAYDPHRGWLTKVEQQDLTSLNTLMKAYGFPFESLDLWTCELAAKTKGHLSYRTPDSPGYMGRVQERANQALETRSASPPQQIGARLSTISCSSYQRKAKPIYGKQRSSWIRY